MKRFHLGRNFFHHFLQNSSARENKLYRRIPIRIDDDHQQNFQKGFSINFNTNLQEQSSEEGNNNRKKENQIKRRKLFEWYSTSHNPLSIDAPDSLFRDHQQELLDSVDPDVEGLEVKNTILRKKETDMNQVYEWMDHGESEMFGFLNEKRMEPRNRTDRWAQWWARRCVARILKFLFGRNMLRYSVFLETMSATPGMVRIKSFQTKLIWELFNDRLVECGDILHL